MVKLTAAGNFGWAETFGGTGGDVVTGSPWIPTGTVHVAGSYQGHRRFRPRSARDLQPDHSRNLLKRLPPPAAASVVPTPDRCPLATGVRSPGGYLGTGQPRQNLARSPEIKESDINVETILIGRAPAST